MARVKKPDIQRHLDELNAVLKGCWLQGFVERKDFAPKRDPKGGAPMGDCDPKKCPKMDRFIFASDVYTSLDGEISPDGTGFTIIWNRHQQGQYLEDGAFFGPAWEVGRHVTWELMKLATAYHVSLANSPARTYYTNWPPKALYKDSAQSTLVKEGQGFTRKTERQEPKIIGQVQIDGLYGASQFHLRTTRNFTEEERSMILYALRLPMAGLVDIQTVAMRRIIVTTTIEPERREEMAAMYAKAINQVLDGGWLWEIGTEFPAVPKLGKEFDELHFQDQKAIIEQYPAPDMNNHKSLRWWKAPTSHTADSRKEQKIVAHSINRLLEEREKRRGT